MTLAPVATRATRRRAPAADRPGLVVLLGTAAAWATLAWGALRPSPAGDHLHHGSGDPAPTGTPADPASLAWIAGWLLMVMAMMWPLLVPTVHRVARAAYPRWRARLTLTTVVTATLLWMALGLLAAAVAKAAGVPAGSVAWQLSFLAVAALAWRSARRTRLLWTCVKLPPVAPGGRRGLLGAARAGVVAWRRCAILCGPVMVAMAVGHHLLVLVAASLSVWWEARHPRAWRDPVPLALLGVAAVGVAGTALLPGLVAS